MSGSAGRALGGEVDAGVGFRRETWKTGCTEEPGGRSLGDITNLVDDLVGAEELEAQFLMRPRSQRGLNIWLEAQVDEVANLECALRSTLVGVGLHTLLSAE